MTQTPTDQDLAAIAPHMADYCDRMNGAGGTTVEEVPATGLTPAQGVMLSACIEDAELLHCAAEQLYRRVGLAASFRRRRRPGKGVKE